MKKKRQHYVWQFYLNEWADSNNQICCLRENTIFRTSTENTAVEKYFYKDIPLSEKDIAFIRLFFSDRTDGVRSMVESQLKFYNSPKYFESIMDFFGSKDEGSQKFLDELRVNFHEDYHSLIESNAISLLKKIKSENYELSPEEFFSLNYYVSMQWTRTKANRIRVENAWVDIDKFGVNRIAITSFMNYIFAYNLAFGLTRDYDMKVINNDTEIEFITGDQPIVNLEGKYDGTLEPPTKLVLYYPLSPKKALFYISKSENNQFPYIDKIKVIELNNHIKKASMESLFATNEDILTAFKNIEGKAI